MKFVKKITALFLAVFLITGTLPLQVLPGFWKTLAGSLEGLFDIRANAYSIENGYEYYLLANNTARIFRLTQYFGGSVTIPATLGGYTVTEIGESVFENKDDVTNVTIPAGLKLIADNAFRSCDGLLSVSFPAGLATIGNNVFMDCIHLTSVSVPDSVTSFGSSVFFNCTALQTAAVGTGITTLPTITFSQCTALVSVTLPAALLVIGYGAFMDDPALKNITIPSSVTEIQQYAFRGCGLTGITFSSPAHLQKLGEGVFYACNGLTQITLPGTLTSFDDGVFQSCNNLTSISIPYGTTRIPMNMFNSCSKLANVSLPNTVTAIDENAFIWCSSLTMLVLPVGLKTIGDAAFYHCANLKSLNLPEGLESFGYEAFASSGLTVFSLPSTLTALPNRAFTDCYNLLSITIPNSVVNFGTDDFTGCYKVTIYCNAGSVAEQYATAKNIPHITIVSVTVTFNANGGTPGAEFTQNCGTALTPPAVTRTGYTFTGWSPAAPAVMPAVNTTYTAQWSLNNYTITFDANGGTGGTTALMAYGTALTPPAVSKDLYILDSWSPAVPATVPAQNTTYTAVWRPIYTYTISNGGAIITDCDTAVSGELIIPSTLDGYPVTSLEYRSFEACTGITSVTIPASVTFIAGRAFYGCTGLTSITIPDNVTSVGNFAFQNCTALATINMPDALTNIGGGVFTNTAWLNAKPDGSVYLGPVYYKYKGTMPIGSAITIRSRTTGIAGGAFSGCSGLISINLPETLTVIGSSAFNACTGLTSMIIPLNVVTIGTSAFSNCTALTISCYPDSYGHIYANTNDIPHTLVAKITFDANGGTGGTSTVMVIGTALTAPTVTRSSFVFSSWSPAVPAAVPEVNAATYTAQWVTLLSYTIAKEEVTITGLNATLNGRLTIPDTLEGYPVRYIAAGAMRSKTGITGVDFPAGLLTIGEQAFRGCTGLTSVTLPTTLTTIEGAAFYGCTNLASVTIPTSVRSMGADVFTGDTALTVYVYPKSYALDYADGNRLNYKVFVTVTFSLNGGTGTLPGTQNGVTGNAVTLPAQGDIAKVNCHFLGWGTSASATAPVASYTMAKANVTLYAVWSLIPSADVRSGASTVINTQSGYIYGLAAGLTTTAFESTYAAITGNGKFQYSPDTGTIGTGTLIQVIDNVTGLPVQTFRVVVYGDVNGDGAINAADADTCVNVQNWATAWDHGTQSYLYKAGDLNGDGNIDAIDADIMTEVANFRMNINQATGTATAV